MHMMTLNLLLKLSLETVTHLNRILIAIFDLEEFAGCNWIYTSMCFLLRR